LRRQVLFTISEIFLYSYSSRWWAKILYKVKNRAGRSRLRFCFKHPNKNRKQGRIEKISIAFFLTEFIYFILSDEYYCSTGSFEFTGQRVGILNHPDISVLRLGLVFKIPVPSRAAARGIKYSLPPPVVNAK
jgi:hypothetical protein